MSHVLSLASSNTTRARRLLLGVGACSCGFDMTRRTFSPRVEIGLLWLLDAYALNQRGAVVDVVSHVGHAEQDLHVLPLARRDIERQGSLLDAATEHAIVG